MVFPAKLEGVPYGKRNRICECPVGIHGERSGCRIIPVAMSSVRGPLQLPFASRASGAAEISGMAA